MFAVASGLLGGRRPSPEGYVTTRRATWTIPCPEGLVLPFAPLAFPPQMLTYEKSSPSQTLDGACRGNLGASTAIETLTSRL